MGPYDDPKLSDLRPTGTPVQKLRQTGWLFCGAAVPVFWVSMLWFYAIYAALAAAALGLFLVVASVFWPTFGQGD